MVYVKDMLTISFAFLSGIDLGILEKIRKGAKREKKNYSVEDLPQGNAHRRTFASKQATFSQFTGIPKTISYYECYEGYQLVLHMVLRNPVLNGVMKQYARGLSRLTPDNATKCRFRRTFPTSSIINNSIQCPWVVK